MTKLRIRSHDESGQMMIMILGFGVVVFLLVSVVVGASQYFVYHRALHAAADGAALAGTNGIDTGAIYDGGVGDDVILSQQEARRKVDEYVSQLQSRDTIRNFRCPGVYVEGSVVTVECNGDVQVPIVNAITNQNGGWINVNVVANSQSFAE